MNMLNERVEKLLAECAAHAMPLTALANDSRVLKPGEVFVAIPGARVDARTLVPGAIAAGAAGVLYENGDGFQAPASWQIPSVGVSGLGGLFGALAARVYNNPSKHLWLLGVTGTNGKTTLTQWLAKALSKSGTPCGVIGTLGAGLAGQVLSESENTTPDALSVQRYLAGFLKTGAQAAAMEVSSIGLVQGRVAHLAFDVAVFTNLTRDHLDYHETMQTYGQAKALLFQSPGLKACVINADDAFGLVLIEQALGRGLEVIATTLSSAAPTLPAGVKLLQAQNIRASQTGLCADIIWGEERQTLDAQTFARFNLSNMVQVLACLLIRGIAFKEALLLVNQLTPPPGRMQAVGSVGEPLVVVDYAHTPDALEKVLMALRETAQARQGQLFCVFGCGGNRDPGKRPQMGAVAAHCADRVWVTSDNPRHESPELIIRQIIEGATEASFLREPERAKAIEAAVMDAGENDVILVAGKGHEPYQEIAGVRYPFSDLEQVRRALAQRSQSKKGAA